MISVKSSSVVPTADGKTRKKYRSLRSQHKWLRQQTKTIANPFLKDGETAIALPIFIPQEIINKIMHLSVLSWPILNNIEEPVTQNDKIIGLQSIKKAAQYQQQHLQKVKQLIQGRQVRNESSTLEDNNLQPPLFDDIDEQEDVQLNMAPNIETSEECLFKDPTRTSERISHSPRIENSLFNRLDHLDQFFH